jgi:hypothetical protein
LETVLIGLPEQKASHGNKNAVSNNHRPGEAAA